MKRNLKIEIKVRRFWSSAELKSKNYLFSKVVFPRMDALPSNVSREAALASTCTVDSTEASYEKK
jgi:hypothetical protein